MFSTFHLQRAATLPMVLVLVAGMTVLNGCGGKENGAGPTERPRETAPAPETPAALTALQLMPEGVQMALGLPSVNSILGKIKTFSDRYESPGFNPQAAVDQWVRELGSEVGMPDATTLGEIATGKGIDPDAPMAAFFDFSPALEAVVAKEERASAKHASVADALEDGDADNAMEHVSAPVSVDVPDADPRWVGVVRTSDPGLARAAIQQAALDSRGIPDEPVDTVTVGNIEITVYDPDRLAFFLSGDFVVFGNSLDLLKESAARVTRPAPLAYGTRDFPAEDPDEIVALFYPGRYLGAMESLVAAIPPDEPAARVARAQMDLMKGMFGDSGENGPIAISLVLDEDALRLRARMDIERNPGMLAFAGKPTPFRILPQLPEDTVAFLGMRLTDEYKQQMLDVILPTASLAAADNPGAGLVVSQFNQIIDLLGDELVLGITRMEYDFPAIYVMAGLKDVGPVKLLLQLAVTPTRVETYRESEISQASGNMPIPVFYTFFADALLVSNDVDGLKAVMDRLAEGKQSELFDRIGGDFSAEKSYYSAFYVDDAIFTDVVIPMAELSGVVLPGLRDAGARITAVVDEMRMTKGVVGKWLYGRVEIGLKPPPTDR